MRTPGDPLWEYCAGVLYLATASEFLNNLAALTQQCESHLGYPKGIRPRPSKRGDLKRQFALACGKFGFFECTDYELCW